MPISGPKSRSGYFWTLAHISVQWEILYRLMSSYSWTFCRVLSQSRCKAWFLQAWILVCLRIAPLRKAAACEVKVLLRGWIILGYLSLSSFSSIGCKDEILLRGIQFTQVQRYWGSWGEYMGDFQTPDSVRGVHFPIVISQQYGSVIVVECFVYVYL
jgi:hypothetical protein